MFRTTKGIFVTRRTETWCGMCARTRRTILAGRNQKWCLWQNQKNNYLHRNVLSYVFVTTRFVKYLKYISYLKIVYFIIRR